MVDSIWPKSKRKYILQEKVSLKVLECCHGKDITNTETIAMQSLNRMLSGQCCLEDDEVNLSLYEMKSASYLQMQEKISFIYVCSMSL